MNSVQTNSLVQQQFGILDQTLIMRQQVLDILTDDDLAFALPGNPTLGELFRREGEFEQMYADSFKTLTHDWTYQYTDATTVETSVAALRTWFTQIEGDLKANASALTEEQIHGQMVDRGEGFVFPVMIQFHLYRETLLIFYAKVVVYLRAMNKTLPQQLALWIG